MSQKKFEESRRRIIRCMHKVIGDCEQLIRDAQCYMHLHPDEKPFDIEPDRITIMNARKILAAAIEGRRIEDEWYDGLIAAASEEFR